MNLQSLSDKAFALHQEEKLSEAEGLCRQILEAEPANFAGQYLLGVIRFQEGRNAEAAELIGAALMANPAAPDALTMLGFVLQTMQRPQEALANYDRALAIKPDFAEALNNRGNALWELQRLEDALAGYDKALAVKPDFAEALNNRGNILRALKRFEEALASYDGALRLKPGNSVALKNRGNVLRDMGHFDEALASYDRALAIKPDYAEALYNRGKLQWTEKRRLEPALRDLERALLIDPDYNYARGDLLHLKMQVADWRGIDREIALIDAGVRTGKRIVRPFAYQAVSQSPADLQACSIIYAGDLYPEAPAVLTNVRRQHGKIRIGYMSGEFRGQATSYLMAGLYERHDKDRFEIVAFDNGRNDNSPTRKRLEAAFDKFVDISQLPDKAAAEAIVAEDIDILVDLNGYFGLSRTEILAHRPAPIQVNYLGFPATLGARYIDYILADRIVIPDDEQQFYSEKVVYLPDTYQANDSQRLIAAERPTRSQCGLVDTAFVFCNFNQSYKLTPATFALWMGIMRQVEGSVLWLLESNTKFSENLRRDAANHGVTSDRLVFSLPIAMEKHLARLPLANLFLDSLPYNAHTSASDALWTGVPLLTCRGNAFPGRVAASLLHAINLPELVTDNLEEFEAFALKLANDPALLGAIRQKLARNRLTTPLFDTDRFRRHIESAYATMWDIHRRGENRRGFNVEPVSA